jgi:hypothetical protein
LRISPSTTSEKTLDLPQAVGVYKQASHKNYGSPGITIP